MKRFKVTLTAEERQALHDLIAVGKAAARKLTHARILLKNGCLAEQVAGDGREGDLDTFTSLQLDPRCEGPGGRGTRKAAAAAELQRHAANDHGIPRGNAASTPADREFLLQAMLRAIAQQEVGDRFGRVVPRANKRRPKAQRYLMEPRPNARKRLHNAA